jgi:hypothetical protein
MFRTFSDCVEFPSFRKYLGKRERKTPLGRQGRRWEDNIKMDLRYMWTRFVWLRIGTGAGLL